MLDGACCRSSASGRDGLTTISRASVTAAPKLTDHYVVQADSAASLPTASVPLGVAAFDFSLLPLYGDDINRNCCDVDAPADSVSPSPTRHRSMAVHHALQNYKRNFGRIASDNSARVVDVGECTNDATCCRSYETKEGLAKLKSS